MAGLAEATAARAAMMRVENCMLAVVGLGWLLVGFLKGGLDWDWDWTERAEERERFWD